MLLKDRAVRFLIRDRNGRFEEFGFAENRPTKRSLSPKERESGLLGTLGCLGAGIGQEER